MTEASPLARQRRAGGAARLRWSVSAAVSGDWIIFLDIARNRYRAAELSAAPAIRGADAEARAADGGLACWLALSREGLLSTPEAASVQLPLPPRQSRARLGDVAMLMRAAHWARGIVRHGRLLDAFAWLSAAKARAMPGEFTPAEVAAHAEAFAAARVWIAAPYVCLFDSLCLVRFLLGRGVVTDLVVGVRHPPFAAHCWLEWKGAIIDDGGETCSSFAEIVRV